MRFVVIILILLFGCDVGTLRAQVPVPPGMWGGKGIQLTVTKTGAEIDYGCDSGIIDGRLRTDSRGKFSARGTHVFGHGGPREPNTPAPRPRKAQYEGVRYGNKLQLAIVLPGLNHSPSRFILKLGQRAILERCG